MKHLSDEDIQAYLDRGAAETAIADDHLKECPSCRRILEEYRALYGALSDEECFAPSTGLATRALSGLKTRAAAKPLREFTETLAAAFGIVAALAVSAWVNAWLDGRSLDFGLAVDTLRRYVSLVVEPLASSANALISVRNEIGFGVMAAFVLFVIFSLDYLFLELRARQGAST